MQKNSNFQKINQKCNRNDINCWRYELQKQFNCSRFDEDCWKKLVPRIPCKLDDTNCWKQQLPNIPCQITDVKCWNKVIPHPPCELADKQCWKSIRVYQAKKQIDHILFELQQTLTDQTQAMID